MNKKEVIKEYNITKKYIVFKKNGMPYEFNTEKECKRWLISRWVMFLQISCFISDSEIDKFRYYIDTKKLVKDQLKNRNYKIINLTKLKDSDEIKNIWIMKGTKDESRICQICKGAI